MTNAVIYVGLASIALKTVRTSATESSVFIQHLTCPAVLARVAKTRVNGVLALVAMVTRCAFTGVLFEASQMTCAAMLAWIRETNITLG